MYQVFESIKVVNHHYVNLTYHLERMQSTCLALWDRIKSFDELMLQLNEHSQESLHKCKVLYDADGQLLEYLPYTKKEIHQLLVISENEISYDYKYVDRSVFKRAEEICGPNQAAIFCKNGLLTDTTFSNIALWNGAEWHTPAMPLLKGTKRQALLDEGRLSKKDISMKDLRSYEKISLINAMLDLGETQIPISQITIL